mgnify:CR=1 FL=1
MTFEQAMDVMLDCGFLPQLPAVFISSSIVNVQNSPNTHFQGTSLSNKKLSLLHFWATWCGPCKTMSPILESLKKEKGEQLRILKIDVDKNKMLASQLGIRSVPTLIYYKSGKLIWRKSGVLSLQELKSSLN